MKIKLTPMLLKTSMELIRNGDTLTINGEVFDFSPLPEGATLPEEAIASDWFDGPVERIDGELHLTLLLPFAPGAPHETRFPEPITVTGDGPVSLPPYNKETDNAAD